MKGKCQFKFHENEVRKIILNMDEKKVNLTGHILVIILTDCVNSYIPLLTNILNTLFEKSYFPNQLTQESLSGLKRLT